MLKNTVQYGKSGGMKVSRTESGNDSSVIGGGMMAQHRLGALSQLMILSMFLQVAQPLLWCGKQHSIGDSHKGALWESGWESICPAKIFESPIYYSTLL